MAQPQPITEAQLDFLNAPLPGDNPTTTTVFDPVESGVWEDEVLTTKYLSTVGEPKRMSDDTRALLNSRVTMFKVRIAELTRLRQRLERPSEIINRELAGHMWKHRFLTRALFRICELPDEVLGIIFSYVVYSGPSASVDHFHKARTSLIWTCKRFRDVALEHRTLWGTVYFTDRYPWTLSFNAILRANTVPLTVGFGSNPGITTLHQGCQPLKPGEINMILAGLSRSVPHLRHVSAVVGDDAMDRLCRWLAPTRSYVPPLTSLQSIRLFFAPEKDSEGDLTEGPPTTLFGGLSELPNLRIIHLDGVRIDWDKQSPTAFANAKALVFATVARPVPTPRSSKWLEILSAASATLVKLELQKFWIFRQHDETFPSTPIELPNLLEFNVHYEHDAQGTEFTFAHFHAPRLACLNVEDIQAKMANFERLLANTHGRFPELRMLSMRFMACYGIERPAPLRNEYFRQFGRWLRALPRLKVLKLGWTYNAIQALLRPLAVPELYLEREEIEELSGKKRKGLPYTLPVCCPELETIAIAWGKIRDPTVHVPDLRFWMQARQTLGKPYALVEVQAIGDWSSEPEEAAKFRQALHTNEIYKFVGRLLISFQPTMVDAERQLRNEVGLGFTLKE